MRKTNAYQTFNPAFTFNEKKIPFELEILCNSEVVQYFTC